MILQAGTTDRSRLMKRQLIATHLEDGSYEWIQAILITRRSDGKLWATLRITSAESYQAATCSSHNPVVSAPVGLDWDSENVAANGRHHQVGKLHAGQNGGISLFCDGQRACGGLLRQEIPAGDS